MGDHADDLINSIIDMPPWWNNDLAWEEYDGGIPPYSGLLAMPDPDDYKLPRRKWWKKRLVPKGLQNPKWNNATFLKCLGRKTIMGLMIRPLKMRKS